jgi:hypothetical protein
MRIVDLRTLPREIADYQSDAKEGIVDALLNLTYQRVSGSGPDGEVVYGPKPSLQWVSGFLLPRYDATTGDDETSDIHLSTHGLDCQIAAEARGQLSVQADFSIYVRALPEWAEITNGALDIYPNPKLRRNVDEAIRVAKAERLPALRAAEAAKPADQRRPDRELQQELYRELLAEHGVSVSDNSVVADAEEEETEGEGAGEAEEPVRLAVQQGRYVFENDNAAEDLDVPSKWRRLTVTLEPLRVELSDPNGIAAAAAAWSEAMRRAIGDTVASWLTTDEGRHSAYRPATLRPSQYRDETAWTAFLTRLRQRPPAVEDIAPVLNELILQIQIEPDLRDHTRRNLRVILENNSVEVGRRSRERFDHAIHQVKLTVDLPRTAHRALKLDRVEPSYRFRDFLSYPAIGINCGINASNIGDDLRLTTTWMPRYQQPRIVPNEIANVPTAFAQLAADGFDPVDLRALIEAYEEWIRHEETTVDPAVGAEDGDEAMRERERFRKDLANYRREKTRIALGIDLLEMAFRHYQVNRESIEGIPYRAWLLLNRTFLEAGAERGIDGWRLFQLTFILAHIPTLSSRIPAFAKSPWFDAEFDEETATLLYFPTGGGKSEAFFGLLIFNLFLDRLRGKSFGVTALVRYPLRLLTLQQAQRLFAVLIRAELLRRHEGLAGQPFEIGFWVGSGNTPNQPRDERLDPVPNRRDAQSDDDEGATTEYIEVNQSFNKIPVCPICKGHTGLRRYQEGTGEEIGIVCFNGTCGWNLRTHHSRLPFLIVDQDIYRHAPSILLGVIDKLALIGQHPNTINRVMGMFGFARWQERETGHFVMPRHPMLKEGPDAHGCWAVAPAYESGEEIFVDPYPSLVIQDEAHLLDESLGTFAGLFETMLEQLFVRGADLLGHRVARNPLEPDRVRLPKVIAATATVSVPQQQFGALYQRRHMHFPFPGTSIYRSFYATPAVPRDAERRALGHGSPLAPEIASPWMRVYTTIMTNGKNHTVTTVAVLAAYHLAMTELWRDLCNENRRPEAIERILRALTQDSPLAPLQARAIEICANGESGLLSTLLDLMRISLTYVTNKKGGDQVIDAFREEVGKIHRRRGHDLKQFHTRLISGGVDVAQIQDIMREAQGTLKLGEEFPDIEQTLRNIVATSAISHGVDLDKFNAMFFAGMPNDIAEFIQASSRVGRTHVGFSFLVPTPHARRDRYIVETHDIFHRFLERMIAPPAITRWAASAHDRILTSLFQAWLCGFVEQRLFIERPDKDRAPFFETINDVNQLLSGPLFPGAARDFMDFAVLAIGIPGRGADRLGAAPHSDYYEDNIRNLAKELTDELQTLYTTTRLADYWKGAAVGPRPMMSLRDIDESGHFVAARPFGTYRVETDDDKRLVKNALRIVRRQFGRVSELDSDEGEA